MPTYNAPRKVEVILYDDDGNKRIAVAERARGYSNLPHWNMALGHPSGRTWPATFNGANIIDALTELVQRKEGEYWQERGRGHRPQPMQADRNVPVDDTGALMQPNITNYAGQRVGISFAREAAATARARSERGER